jgi:hypothetical protein
MLKRAQNFMLGICLVLALTPTASGQLLDDPANLPVTLSDFFSSGRAVVVKVIFNSSTDVSLQGVLVSNTPARTSIGNPPMLLLELLDSNGQVLDSQHEWHPLLVSEWDESGTGENMQMEFSGEGVFYVPLSETLAAVRITDLDLGLELITVDVVQEVSAYCKARPNAEPCMLFGDGFE